MESSQILGALFGFSIMVFLWLGLGAIFLRIACNILGIDRMPSFGRAIYICFAAFCANFVAMFGFGLVVAAAGGANAGPIDQSMFNLVAIAVGAVVTPAVYSSMLSESFLKGFLVWLLQAVAAIFAIFCLGFMFGILTTMTG